LDKEIVISIKTVIFTLLLLLGAYVIYRIGPIISLLLVALLIVFAVEPFIKKLMKINIMNQPISRGVAVLVVYLLLIFILILVVTTIVPTFVVQVQKLLTNMASIFAQLNVSEQIDFSTEGIITQFSRLSSGFVSALYGSFRVIFTIFSVLILSIYMSSDWENLKMRFSEMFSAKQAEEVLSILEEIETSIGHWVKGQVILMVVVGVASFIGLLILDVDYALALGLLAGVLEVVPMIGPVIAAVFSGVVGFVDSPIKGVGVVVLFIIIQQLENNILVPKIMQKVSGFSPLLILIALLVGGEMFGVLGAVLAIPFTMIGHILLKRVLASRV